ncbi:rCG37151 [Rattus norvegicus]|uniref:RCG37151 n=1 Tax=Rattus norvegicus TaxID=10116 RepID=A6HU53_RAT|nr:rCG37151 [Rattus norvegicus]
MLPRKCFLFKRIIKPQLSGKWLEKELARVLTPCLNVVNGPSSMVLPGSYLCSPYS